MSARIENPCDVPEAQAIIRRLCALQAHVCSEVLGYTEPTDCFCGEDGFWPLDGPEDFHNSGRAIAFIEDAVLAAVKAVRAGGKSG